MGLGKRTSGVGNVTGRHVPSQTVSRAHCIQQNPFYTKHSALVYTMSTPAYFLVSLPTSISPSNDKDEALTALRSVITTDNGDTSPFNLPSFKIGTLDALVQQADELGKLSGGCEGVVGKVADSLRSLLEGDEDKIAQQKTVNESETAIGHELKLDLN